MSNNLPTFDQLKLDPAILKAVKEQGYDTPTPIQTQSIPAVLAGRDVMAAAQTGTGKTAGFTLPLLQNLISTPKNPQPQRGNQVRALIITPTRELAAQVADNVTAYSKYLSITSEVVFGGVKINPQMQRLRGGVDVLVATPGRLLDLYNQNAIRFDHLEILVLDEADRMLDMGFIHDIKKIIKLVPPKRQNLLYSATFSQEIRDLAKGLINDPVEISVAVENTTAEKVSQLIYPCDQSRKAKLLIKLIKDNGWYQVLIFTRTKHGANRLAKQLEASGISSSPIHGNKSQGARTRALAGFKAGDIQALVATDIAARGIDIDLLPHVVNFELPKVPEDYVHRIGRTGRAGSEGQAVSLVCADELKSLKAIERLIQQVIPRETIAEFAPQKKLHETVLDTRPIRKRPKKNKSRSNNGENSERKGQKEGSRANGGNRSNKPNKTNGNRSNISKPSGNKSGNSSSRSNGNRSSNAKPNSNGNGGQRRRANANRKFQSRSE